MEALVAMVLSTVVVFLVASAFLAQNSFYSDAVRRSALQENVRGAIALVSAELRPVTLGGVAVAEANRVVFRAPLAVGGVCAISGSSTYLLFPLGGEGMDGSAVTGYAVQHSTGRWTYTEASWAGIFHSSGAVPAATCALAGADTAGAAGDFFRLEGLSAAPPLTAGDLVMIYRQMELKLDDSALDSTGMALFRGPSGGTLTEFATGLTGGSSFTYRVEGRSDFQDRITGAGNLSRVATVRFLARGSTPSARGGRGPLTFDLTATVPLRNAN